MIKAINRLMRPLVRILIRYGLSYSEMAELIKRLYVDVANKDYAINARRQSISRIAIMTGLGRKEVQKCL